MRGRIHAESDCGKEICVTLHTEICREAMKRNGNICVSKNSVTFSFGENISAGASGRACGAVVEARLDIFELAMLRSVFIRQPAKAFAFSNHIPGGFYKVIIPVPFLAGTLQFKQYMYPNAHCL